MTDEKIKALTTKRAGAKRSLASRAQVEGVRLQNPKPASERSNNINNNNRSNTRSQQTFATTTHEQSCVFCGENTHLVYNCTQFAALDPHTRYEASRNGGWCTNCLRKGHRASKCTSQPCRNCKLKHHTLLHFEKANNSSNQSVTAQVSSHFVANSTILQAQTSSHVLLATALVDMVNHQGNSKTIRAMPSITINQSSLDIPKNIKLADPDFFKSSKVDALIGVKFRMQRVIACILRFIHNVKKPSSERKFGPLLSTELNPRRLAKKLDIVGWKVKSFDPSALAAALNSEPLTTGSAEEMTKDLMKRVA
ncbi:Protein of unknown function [Cotesia congregata]|uniref:CCHC-type domain-containing protein n=1 Tax=Cotesia congregata TaxID=51543 RepID=A0A8J2HSY5_COTCN|nr:Protein of unknown function [Cotesia congregata]